MRALSLFLLLTAPALAETPMTAQEFDTFVTGKTLDYAQYGSSYGIERYLPNRRVRWERTDGLCQTGFWYPEGEQICFLYDGDPEPNCFTFRLEGDVLVGRFALDSADMPPHYAHQTNAPLTCTPEVGV